MYMSYLQLIYAAPVGEGLVSCWDLARLLLQQVFIIVIDLAI